ncbi:unnamed protein product [Adineta ricciae]|uniref:Uncharacterized protein n=1 Tax=Adineta ricciae TaxID=249248 RepID=A0A814R449_ADIRI|nr:unnamed protein product [Adineta ricciae]
MDFSLLGPPVRYSQFPLIVERSLNHLPIVSIYAQCSASNCPNSRTCCPNNKLATKMHCCEQNTPICCSPDQGWCCRIKTPVCCGKYNCCPLNTTCCTIRGIEDCCPVSVNTSITNELAIL